jgi:hypothetical protein
MDGSATALRAWFSAYPGDVRDIEPEDLPPGACPRRVHRDGDPSSPCVLPKDHDDDCIDTEGYRSDR